MNAYRIFEYEDQWHVMFDGSLVSTAFTARADAVVWADRMAAQGLLIEHPIGEAS